MVQTIVDPAESRTHSSWVLLEADPFKKQEDQAA
jgi:hypothetical protein